MDSVPRRAYFLLLLASVVFYLPGLLPGRILLPLDVLCWQLPWSNTPVCQGRTPSNPIISDLVLQLHPWREVIRRDGWRAALWNPYAFAGSPMPSSISITGPGAPPCKGPFRALIPASTAEVRPARVEATTRAANVEALRP